jgi:hypothetical protein
VSWSASFEKLYSVVAFGFVGKSTSYKVVPVLFLTEVSGQLQASAALLAGKEPLVLLE